MSIGYQEPVKAIDLTRLKKMIDDGFDAIPKDDDYNQAVIIIGDTGVGKSTIISYFLGYELYVEGNAHKAYLTTKQTDKKVKIGHDRFSETAVPNKIIIEDIVFYDCPGFQDNKGEQYEISNSFFVQRLLDIYKHVKIVLLIEEAHITQTRSEKLPRLIKNLVKSFQTLQDIQEGVVMVINKANRQLALGDYQSEIRKMITLKIENKNMFDSQQANFMQYLLNNKRICLFRAPLKQQKGQKFVPSEGEKNIMKTIKGCKFVKSRHILNILSQSAKIAIREFIDQVTFTSNQKISKICGLIVTKYKQKIGQIGQNVSELISAKNQVINLAQRLRKSQPDKIITTLSNQLKNDKDPQSNNSLKQFTADFQAVLFFKNIYNKTDLYFQNLINKAYAQLTHLLVHFDSVIIDVQKKEVQVQQRQRKQERKVQVRQKREKEKSSMKQQMRRLDELKSQVNRLGPPTQLEGSLTDIADYLNEMQKNFSGLKQRCLKLQQASQIVYKNLGRMEQTYLGKRFY